MSVLRKRSLRKLWVIMLAALICVLISAPALAAASGGAEKKEIVSVTEEVNGGDNDVVVTKTVETDETAADPDVKAAMAALCVGVVAAVGVIGMCVAISKAESGIASRPEAAGNIQGAMMLGLVFIETAIIYALIVGILIIFVL